MYFFFGRVQSNSLALVAMIISSVAFLAHAVLLILQIVQAVRMKRKAKGKTETEETPAD